MKKTRVFLIGLCIFSTCSFSCRKEPRSPYDEIKHKNTGYLSAVINGKKWVSNLVINSFFDGRRFDPGGSVYINGLDRQGIIFINVLPQTGIKQKIYSRYNSAGFSDDSMRDSTSVLFYLADHDVGEAYYDPVIGEGNYIMVESYDALSRRATGKFQVKVFTKEEPTQGFSDTLRVTDGYFEVTIKENND